MDQKPSTTPQAAQAVEVETVRKDITKLPEHAKHAEVVAKINELVDRANGKRDRGPASTRNMSVEDAERIMIGDMKDVSHTDVAEKLGLSYGQVYSARKGFTFKGVYQRSAKSW